MDPSDLLGRTTDLPDVVVRYADHSDGVIDMYLPPRSPDRPRPESPLVVLLHGGFWRATYDRVHIRPVAAALASDGAVVAVPEYRRVGGGGGWPATFDDVTAAMDALPRLLGELDVPVSGTTVVGHSAGGHLALWLATEPHAVDRVVALAPVGDLRSAALEDVGGSAVPGLLGGMPEQVPDRYDRADPGTRLAQGSTVELVVIHGVDDVVVPVGNSRALAARHPAVKLVELEGVEHFAVIDPASPAWPVVRDAVRGTLPC